MPPQRRHMIPGFERVYVPPIGLYPIMMCITRGSATLKHPRYDLCRPWRGLCGDVPLYMSTIRRVSSVSPVRFPSTPFVVRSPAQPILFKIRVIRVIRVLKNLSPSLSAYPQFSILISVPSSLYL